MLARGQETGETQPETKGPPYIITNIVGDYACELIRDPDPEPHLLIFGEKPSK